MVKSEDNSFETRKIVAIAIENARNELSRKILGEIDERITNDIKDAMKGVKLQIKSAFDAMELMSQSQELFQKQINLRLGALTGHVERKMKPQREEMVADGLELEEAVVLANIERKKQGLPPLIIPQIEASQKQNVVQNTS
jgi:hypothetical protein